MSQTEEMKGVVVDSILACADSTREGASLYNEDEVEELRDSLNRHLRAIRLIRGCEDIEDMRIVLLNCDYDEEWVDQILD